MLLWATVAAAAPPPDLDLEDITAWEAAAFDLTRSPRGACWELTGGLSIRLALYHSASVFSGGGREELVGEGTFRGRMQDGVWTAFAYRLSEGSTELDLPVIPLAGSIDPSIVVNEALQEPEAAETPEDGRSVSVSVGIGGDSSDAVSLLRDAIDEWFSSSVTTSYVRWDDARSGAELVIEVPTSGGWFSPVLTATAFFPGGGTTATSLDAVFPRRLTIGEWPLRAKIMDGQLHLRGQVVEGMLLPSQESLSAMLGVAGITAGVEQRIVYATVAECSASP